MKCQNFFLRFCRCFFFTKILDWCLCIVIWKCWGEKHPNIYEGYRRKTTHVRSCKPLLPHSLWYFGYSFFAFSYTHTHKHTHTQTYTHTGTTSADMLIFCEYIPREKLGNQCINKLVRVIGRVPRISCFFTMDSQKCMTTGRCR